MINYVKNKFSDIFLKKTEKFKNEQKRQDMQKIFKEKRN
jgi:hypothetical protein